MSKKFDKIKREAVEMLTNKKLIEKSTALATIRANIPTAEEMAKFSFTFDRNNFDMSQQFLISRIFTSLEYLAKKIDGLSG